MGKLTSPYNFVPLNSRVYVPSWAEQVSQDIPFSDGEDGWIEVTWRNVSPLIVRDGIAKDEEGSSLPVHVTEAGGKRLYFIPATSLKGMLRAALEILSFGKMEQYDNRYFGHREFDTRLSEGRTYQKEMQKVRWGWLSKEDDEFYLSPCLEDVEKISISELTRKYPGLEAKVSQWERNSYIAKCNTLGMFPEKDGYRLYCTGKMHGKKHEYLIPIATEERRKLTAETRDSFLTVYEPTPDFDKFIALLDDGEMIPVSFIEQRGEVFTVGLSRMLRLPYNRGLRSLVEKEQPPVEGHDLPETIFGYTCKDDSLRGRVQISNAFCVDTLDVDVLCNPVSGVLGEPKPSFYHLYLKQSGPKYKTFNDAEGIAGRKLYRVHSGSSVMPLPQGNDNNNVKTAMHPLRKGLSFAMRINLHNMRSVEIGALLSALTLHDTKDAWHNLGSAKSFGYGKLECSGVSLCWLKYDREYYLQAFEQEMELFTRDVLKQKWRETEQVKKLIGILSEHDNEDVRIMDLTGYKAASKNDSFERLVERDRQVNTLLPQDFEDSYADTAFHSRYRQLYDEAEALGRGGKLDEAKSKYSKLVSLRIQNGLDTESENNEIKTIEDEIRKKEEERQLKLKKEEEARRKAKLDAGLAAELEARYPDGRYKRDTVKKAVDVAKGWLKKIGKASLDKKEAQDLLSTLKRLKSAPCKADVKLWNDRKNRIWDDIETLTGKRMV